MNDKIRFLDELAGNAWSAIIQQQFEGWRLRFSNGVTRRANSVLTNGPTPNLANWLEEIEAFYRRRNLPSRFQISPGSPAGLDDFLEQQGYTIDAETTVMTASTSNVCDLAKSATRFTLDLQPALTADWLDALIGTEGFPEARRHDCQGIFGGVAPLACLPCLSVGDIS